MAHSVCSRTDDATMGYMLALWLREVCSFGGEDVIAEPAREVVDYAVDARVFTTEEARRIRSRALGQVELSQLQEFTQLRVFSCPECPLAVLLAHTLVDENLDRVDIVAFRVLAHGNPTRVAVYTMKKE